LCPMLGVHRAEYFGEHLSADQEILRSYTPRDRIRRELNATDEYLVGNRRSAETSLGFDPVPVMRRERLFEFAPSSLPRRRVEDPEHPMDPIGLLMLMEAASRDLPAKCLDRCCTRCWVGLLQQVDLPVKASQRLLMFGRPAERLADRYEDA